MSEKLKQIEVEAGISSAGGTKAVSQEGKEEQEEDATSEPPGCTVCTAWMKQEEGDKGRENHPRRTCAQHTTSTISMTNIQQCQ